MRSSAFAGFLASVFVSGSAGFASTFLVGPYLGQHVRHQLPRAALMSSTAVDPLAVLTNSAGVAARLEGEPPASQREHRLRNVANQASPAATSSAPATEPAASTAPTAASTTDDMPPVTEEAFAPTTPSVIPASAGGPLIATETTSELVSSRLENGEPVLTLRIAPVVAANIPAVDSGDPDNAVEPTTISAPPSEQALATPTVAMTAAPVSPAPPVAAPVEPQHTLAVHPRVKPALSEPKPAPVEPAALPRHSASHARTTPARVTTTAAPAKPALDETQPEPAAPDPLNAPFAPPTMPVPEDVAAPAPAPTPASPPAAPSTGGPTPLVMPQN